MYEAVPEKMHVAQKLCIMKEEAAAVVAVVRVSWHVSMFLPPKVCRNVYTPFHQCTAARAPSTEEVE